MYYIYSDKQHFVDYFSTVHSDLGLTISRKKTIEIYPPGPEKAYFETSACVYGQKVKIKEKFLYLDSIVWKMHIVKQPYE